MRGQAYISFVISAVIFLFVILYTIAVMMNVAIPHTLQTHTDERSATAFVVLDFLTTDSGHWNDGALEGDDWENHRNDVTRLGLASDYLVLDRGKMTALKGLNDDRVRGLLGDDYDYKICVSERGECDLLDVKTNEATEPTERSAKMNLVLEGGRRVSLEVSVE